MRHLLLLLALVTGTAAAETPRIVASIPPLQALAALVLDGVATPQLLFDGSSSPHHTQLRPSQARALAEADLVLWMGPELEASLVRPLRGHGERALALLERPGLEPLPLRDGGLWERDDHAPHRGMDPHLWLDPLRARVLVGEMSAALADRLPEHAERLAANARAAQARLEALDQELAATLATVSDVPYLVFHDAYQYLERRYRLSAQGAVLVEPEQPPGARRVTEIRQRILDSGTRCIFREPQFDHGLIATLTAGTQARVGVLDPLGATPSADGYFTLLRELASALRDCLQEA